MQLLHTGWKYEVMTGQRFWSASVPHGTYTVYHIHAYLAVKRDQVKSFDGGKEHPSTVSEAAEGAGRATEITRPGPVKHTMPVNDDESSSDHH